MPRCQQYPGDDLQDHACLAGDAHRPSGGGHFERDERPRACSTCPSRNLPASSQPPPRLVRQTPLGTRGLRPWVGWLYEPRAAARRVAPIDFRRVPVAVGAPGEIAHRQRCAMAGCSPGRGSQPGVGVGGHGRAGAGGLVGRDAGAAGDPAPVRDDGARRLVGVDGVQPRARARGAAGGAPGGWSRLRGGRPRCGVAGCSSSRRLR